MDKVFVNGFARKLLQATKKVEKVPESTMVAAGYTDVQVFFDRGEDGKNRFAMLNFFFGNELFTVDETYQVILQLSDEEVAIIDDPRYEEILLDYLRVRERWLDLDLAAGAGA